ncbi:hypothetical protein ETB97_008833 [Aspergillus alliaceus]|uniref:Uncharacterized protein n=1 Tax=Petromyces alliaceus TaxID=209559 RepID=A0A8H6E2B8_PETAA|nr:hypothetical protein ETB97_008833 [Aspergillus burnettii]
MKRIKRILIILTAKNILEQANLHTPKGRDSMLVLSCLFGAVDTLGLLKETVEHLYHIEGCQSETVFSNGACDMGYVSKNATHECGSFVATNLPNRVYSLQGQTKNLLHRVFLVLCGILVQSIEEKRLDGAWYNGYCEVTTHAVLTLNYQADESKAMVEEYMMDQLDADLCPSRATVQ